MGSTLSRASSKQSYLNNNVDRLFKDRVKETTTTTGTGTLTLAGALTGFDAFSEIGMTVSDKEYQELLFGDIASPYMSRAFYSNGDNKRTWVQNFQNMLTTPQGKANFMNYNNSWEEKEKIIDINEAKNKKRKKDFKNSISGLSLSDVLIMNNWLNYAKEIDDTTYKNISEDMFYSDYISKTISPQLEKRKNEFLKLQ